MILNDRYRLEYVKSTTFGSIFLLEKPFIPVGVAPFVVINSPLTKINGVELGAKDLRFFMQNANAFDIVAQNLIHMDLTTFIIPPGVYDAGEYDPTMVYALYYLTENF